MVKVVTAEEMQEIDRITIEEYGIPSLVLMERAGLAVALKVRELLYQMEGESIRAEDRGQKTNNGHKKVLVLCGSGNNGGDGIVAARNLYNWGFNVNVIIFAKMEDEGISEDSLSPDCNAQHRIARKMGVPVEFRKSINEKDLHGVNVLIDAIFGTGLSRPVSGEFAQLFSFINKKRTNTFVFPAATQLPPQKICDFFGTPHFSIVSVDIPSGISSNTGEILGEAIRADCTVTFGLPKRGHFLYPGAEYTGRLFIEDIGFPERLLSGDRLKVGLISKEIASCLMPPRPRCSHKGDYGHILIIAGSKGKTGAALMAAKACLKSGAGLVTVAVPESLIDIFQNRVTEEMTLPLPDDGKGMLSSKAIDEILNFAAQKIDVIAIGPGMGVSHDTEKIMNELIQKSTVPMVVDADGINSIGNSRLKIQSLKEILRKAKAPIVLTPHPGEMARLLNQKSEEKELRVKIEKDRINTALSFSKETGTYLVLKGVPTIIAEPGGNAFINTTGNPGMATAGSGDVLTGVIASLLGQDLSPMAASMLGVYIHGLAGDIAAKVRGEHSLIASDIIDFLPDAFLKLVNG